MCIFIDASEVGIDRGQIRKFRVRGKRMWESKKVVSYKGRMSTKKVKREDKLGKKKNGISNCTEYVYSS